MKNNLNTLKDVISYLEVRQIDELNDLKTQFEITYESLKPINLLKSTLYQVSQSNEIKNSLLKSAVAVFVGYLTKKVLVGKSSNNTRNLLGNIVQFTLTNLMARPNRPSA